ncbi:hypothetical protein EV210_10444 [Anaerospora hongkongensis]|uniref:Uncharacterized protein n=1 Tax=Anaerospora hongkongensis TaxID=244830 RepID=A0A4R1Q187_9FIRM|nr:hypothetical protein [Anaerospora hongkongensis]TCL38078.1 hypothetical protein EV210_10444 [Anaerospora hongkongensis]
MNYTLADLEKAKVNIERLEKAWDNYSGNNPNKHHTSISMAREEVSRITYCLKLQGDISKTEQEILEDKLNRAFPNAQSKLVINFEEAKYQRQYCKIGGFWEDSWRKLD